MEAITGALIEGEKVQLVGFGSFEVQDPRRPREPPPRPGGDPHFQARLPVFKAGKALRRGGEVRSRSGVIPGRRHTEGRAPYFISDREEQKSCDWISG